MTSPKEINDAQRIYWNGKDGEYWTRQQDRLDRLLSPVMDPLLAFAAPRRGSAVIDDGCGCGATTIELAHAVGASGRVIGIDISEEMLALAKDRLSGFSNATCRLGDAAELPLQDCRADLMVSRFGVMFFADPVAAFTNLRTGLAPGARLCFVCWRPINENPWLMVPLQAVYEHAPRIPKPDPEEPGPFSFADTARVTRILTAAGFAEVAFSPLDFDMDLAGDGTFEDAVELSAHMGPAKRALADQPDEIKAAAVNSIRQALKPYALTDGVKLRGAAWLVSARRCAP
jgi:SAM-dependent methyltransferase